MSKSVLAASDFSLETSWKQAEMGTLSPFECLSFANTIQADLPTCVLEWLLGHITVKMRGKRKDFISEENPQVS